MQVEEILKENWLMKTIILKKTDHNVIVGELVGIIRDTLLIEADDTEVRIKCEDVLSISEAGEEEKNALIKTNFVDPTLFKGEEAKIFGSLDSFYDAPLLFANPSTEIFANGVDILFNTI